MKKAGKILRISLLALLVIVVAGISFTIGWRPFIGPKKRALTARHFERTPARVARGKYLVQGLLGCESCHSPKDWATHGAPLVFGMELAGQALDLPGFPGSLSTPNLTPDPETGGANWTDDQIGRAIREGIKHDDTTLFPMMPYANYRNLSDEDVASVVVFLRSIPAVRHAVPPAKINFPVNYLVRGAPEPVTASVASPSLSDRVAAGKYYVTLGCGCHGAVESMPYAGGEYLKGPWGEATSANITPDPSGIGYYDEAKFVQVLKTGYVGARKLNSIMPFGEFKNLNDDDLKSMFAYLHTLAPVKHHVDNTLPPTYCELCKQKHGAGDQN
jgi:hypothetical protein